MVEHFYMIGLLGMGRDATIGLRANSIVIKPPAVMHAFVRALWTSGRSRVAVNVDGALIRAIRYGGIAICVGEKGAIGVMSCANIAVTESAECRRGSISGVRHEAVGFARHLIHR